MKSKNIDAYFKNKLTHDDTEQQTLRSELHGFTMELNLRVPKGYDLTKITHKNVFNFIKTNFEDSATHALKSASNWPYTIFLARPNELASLIIKKVTHYANQDELRIIMTGLIIPKDNAHYDYAELENGAYLNFSIALPNLKSRKIQALVRPYYSTYVDFVMAP